MLKLLGLSLCLFAPAAFAAQVIEVRIETNAESLFARGNKLKETSVMPVQIAGESHRYELICEMSVLAPNFTCYHCADSSRLSSLEKAYLASGYFNGKVAPSFFCIDKVEANVPEAAGNSPATD